jgi:hypothetical protein
MCHFLCYDPSDHRSKETEMTLSIFAGTVENPPRPFAFAFGIMYCMPMSNSGYKGGEPSAVYNQEGREDLDRFRIAYKTASRMNIHPVVMYSLGTMALPVFFLNSQRRFGKTEALNPTMSGRRHFSRVSQPNSWQP